MTIKSICVFCGSNPGENSLFKKKAIELGELIAQNGQRLIYGGASLGLMGAVADSALREGGEVIGIIPQGLVDKELAHHGLTQSHIVKTMHERKAKMADLSDAFIILPGGSGTMDEFFEIWTWAQLGMHTKPIGLLNYADYYTHLKKFMAHQVEQGFIRKAHMEMLFFGKDAQDMLKEFQNFKPPIVNKWIEKEDL